MEDGPLIRLTAAALAKVDEIRRGNAFPGACLRVAITSGRTAAS